MSQWEAKFPKRIRRALEKFPNIRCDRNIVSGQPCVANRRIPTWVVAGRYAAGDTISSIAEDYEISSRDVTEALRFTCWLSEVGNIQFWKMFGEKEKATK